MRRAFLVVSGLAAGLSLPVAHGQQSAGNAFNPAISLVLSGQYASYGYDPAEFALPGFQLGGEAHPKPEGLSADHTELVLSANIDHRFYGQVSAALATHDDETKVELEEAFVETLGLPAGLGVKFGRFRSGLGYINQQHGHAWDFVDAPLPVQAFLGGGYYDDGLRLSWLAPTDTMLEISVEALRGRRFPAADEGGGAPGAYTASIKVGGDVGASHSWQAGISGLWASPRQRGGGHAHGHDDHDHDHAAHFSGDSDLLVLDLVWKWAPGGNAAGRGLVLQSEYFQRREDGAVEVAHGDHSHHADYRGTQRGWYGQAVYRFSPRWRAGLRYDRLWSDNRGDPELLAEAGLADGGSLWRASAMLDFATSEFARLRLQYTRDETQPKADDQWLLQYVMALGAHGAHGF